VNLREIGPAALATAAALVLAPASIALAAPVTGSVPASVSAYVADGSLVQRLADIYGVDAAGDGIDFDETTAVGAVTRVYGWSDEKLASVATDRPVRLLNDWIAPITVAGEAVGLATIWINPDTEMPELATFAARPDIAEALADIPADVALVRDDASGAWFTVADDTATVLYAGDSGLTTPVPVDRLDVTGPLSAAPAPVEAGNPIGVVLGLFAVLVVAVLVAVLVPRWRRAR
jgi:hypothetical protein